MRAYDGVDRTSEQAAFMRVTARSNARDAQHIQAMRGARRDVVA